MFANKAAHASLPRAAGAPTSALARKGCLWTADEDALLVRMRRDEGRPADEIAQALGRTRATVYTRLRQLGVLIETHRRWDEGDFERALDLLRAGESVAAAAAAVGRTESELRGRLADRKISVPGLRPAAMVAARLERAQVDARARVERRALAAAEARAARRAAAQARKAEKAARAPAALKWTQTRIAELAAAYQDGQTDAARLAVMFDVTPRRINDLLVRLGIRAKKRERIGMTPEKRVEAITRLRAGETVSHVARDLRVDLRTLKATLGDDLAAIMRDASDRRQSVILARRDAVAERQHLARQTRLDAEREAREAQKAAIAQARAAASVRAREDAERLRETMQRQDVKRQEVPSKVKPQAGLHGSAARQEGKAPAAGVNLPAADALRAALARKRALVSGSSKAEPVAIASVHTPVMLPLPAQPAVATKIVSRAEMEAKKPTGPGKPAMFRARRAKLPETAPQDLAALVAAHMATRGVTRIVDLGDDALLAGLRRRGYVVLQAAEGWTIDDRFVASGDLAAFAEKRGVVFNPHAATAA